ncbi:MAG: Uma2 family endonuclease [bacterium]|nr:Uma2 family endonuclease [bacterium]
MLIETAAQTRTTRMTVEEYLNLPETNQIAQLINGEYIVNPPLDVHQAVVGKLYLKVGNILTTGTLRIAPTGLYLEESNYYEPDIFWISPENTGCTLRPDGRYWQGAPDLIVEVLSPSTASFDKVDKFRLYQKHGVREYWIADPVAEYLEVFAHNGGRFNLLDVFKPGDTLQTPLLGEHVIQVRELFA